ncbi:ATP-dependent Clp protease adapter ClpS [Luteococcus sp. H138]|uniref:ATP-dependent Clp protease adapter ClpS n=1 Tax=unclassified Luteococcus TaxID=2639923 RepID=UPI00313C7FA5
MSSEPTITPSGGTAVVERTDESAATQQPWVTLVWDDPVNLMSYVTHVFTSYFGYPKEKAEQLMLEVHNEGKSAVSMGGREQMERDVNAMHGYGLWATMERAE